MNLNLILIVLFAVLVAWSLHRLRKRLQLNHNKAPKVVGWLPWIGCAVQFQKDPIKLMRECQEKYGEIFTLYIGGRHMTFFCNPAKLRSYFYAPKTHVSFDLGVQEFISRVFAIPFDDFLEGHSTMLNTLRICLAPAYCEQYTLRLQKILTDIFNTPRPEEAHPLPNGKFEADIAEWLSEVLFTSTASCLFGEDWKTWKDRWSCFRAFDEGFELASSGLPQSLMKKFTESRAKLQKNFKDGVEALKRYNKENAAVPPSSEGGKKFEFKNVLESLCTALGDKETATNWLLAALWASQANSVPGVYLTIANILGKKEVLAKVLEEIRTKLPAKKVGEPAPVITYQQLLEMTYVRDCINEAMRVYSLLTVVRRTTAPYSYITSDDKEVIIPPGNTICVCPFVVHHREERYENPYEYNPDRFSNGTKLDLFDFIPFGRGSNECPGAKFAMMELILFVCMFFMTFECEPVAKVPGPDYKRMIGLLPLKGPVRIVYSRKKQE